MGNSVVETKNNLLNEIPLKDVFREVQNINKLLIQFSRQAKVLREISVNSAIAAGHVDIEASALSEIAKQVGILSAHLGDSVAEAHEATRQMSSLILSSIVEAEKYQKMQEALDLMQSSSFGNQSTIKSVSFQIGNGISEKLNEAKKYLQNLCPILTRITQLIQRMWSIVISLKVSSSVAESDDEGEENSFFLPIAGSLEEMVKESTSHTEELVQLVTSVERAVTRARALIKRGQYAA